MCVSSLMVMTKAVRSKLRKLRCEVEHEASVCTARRLLVFTNTPILRRTRQQKYMSWESNTTYEFSICSSVDRVTTVPLFSYFRYICSLCDCVPLVVRFIESEIGVQEGKERRLNWCLYVQLTSMVSYVT